METIDLIKEQIDSNHRITKRISVLHYLENNYEYLPTLVKESFDEYKQQMEESLQILEGPLQ